MTKKGGRGWASYQPIGCQRASALLLFHSLFSVNYKLMRAVVFLLHTVICGPRDKGSADKYIINITPRIYFKVLRFMVVAFRRGSVHKEAIWCRI